MRIIGIHDNHNAAACLLENGAVTAALQEERITRIKNHDIFPAQACGWLLEQAGLKWSDINAVAMNGDHQPIHRDRQALIQATRWGGGCTPLQAAIKRLARRGPILAAWKARRRRTRQQEAAAAGIDPAKLVYIDHHECHAQAAYWGSPWRGEPVLVLTCDGAGDDLCATVSTADAQGKLTRLAAIHESHSPAMVYLVVTTLLGMVPNEHEYKLMGMAPYAATKYMQQVCGIFEKLLEWDPAQPLAWRRRAGIPNLFYCYDYLKEALDLQRFDSICGGMQLWVERLLAEWVRRAIRQTGIRKVALAGGIFMNVKANKAISEIEELDDLFIFPSCGDETNSMGAAFAAYSRLKTPPQPPIAPLGPIYWGPASTPEQMQQALEAQREHFNFHQPANMAEHAAEFLERGAVVARYDGRAEFGARGAGQSLHPGQPLASRCDSHDQRHDQKPGLLDAVCLLNVARARHRLSDQSQGAIRALYDPDVRHHGPAAPDLRRDASPGPHRPSPDRSAQLEPGLL